MVKQYKYNIYYFLYYYYYRNHHPPHTQTIRRNPLYISTCASLTAPQTTEAQLLVSAASPHVLHSQHHRQLKHSSSSLLHLHMCFTHSITDNWSTAPRLRYISTCASLTAPQTTEAQLLISAASPLHLHMCFTHSTTDNWSTAPHLCCISTCASLTASQTTEAQLLISAASPHVLHSQHHKQLKHSSSSLLHLHMCFTHSITEAQLLVSAASPHVLHSQHHRQLKHSSSSPLHLHMCFTHSTTDNWSTAPRLRCISTCASLTAPQTTEAQLLVSAASPHVLHSQHHRQLKHSSSSLLHLHMCFTHSITDNWSTSPRLRCISTCASLTASQTTEAQLLVSAASPHVLHSQHHRQLKHSSSSLLHLRYISTCASLTASQTTEAQLLVSAASPHVLHSQHHRQLKHSSSSLLHLHMCFTHSITDNWSTAPPLHYISTCVSLTAPQTTEAQLLISAASPHVFHSQHHRQLKHSSSSLLHLHMCFTHSITDNWSAAPRLCCISTCASLTASQTTEAQLLVSAINFTTDIRSPAGEVLLIKSSFLLFYKVMLSIDERLKMTSYSLDVCRN